LFVGDMLKTGNAKVMRRIVHAAYLGEKLGAISALEKPALLDAIKRAVTGVRWRARSAAPNRDEDRTQKTPSGSHGSGRLAVTRALPTR